MNRKLLEQVRDALQSLFSGQYDPDRPKLCSEALAAIEAELVRPEPVAVLTDERIDAIWDEWFGRRGFQSTQTEARREYARLIAAAIDAAKEKP